MHITNHNNNDNTCYNTVTYPISDRRAHTLKSVDRKIRSVFINIIHLYTIKLLQCSLIMINGRLPITVNPCPVICMWRLTSEDIIVKRTFWTRVLRRRIIILYSALTVSVHKLPYYSKQNIISARDMCHARRGNQKRNLRQRQGWWAYFASRIGDLIFYWFVVV